MLPKPVICTSAIYIIYTRFIPQSDKNKAKKHCLQDPFWMTPIEDGNRNVSCSSTASLWYGVKAGETTGLPVDLELERISSHYHTIVTTSLK